MVNCLVNSNNICTFEGWIGGSCKPSDKGKLTALPHFIICQQKQKNVSEVLRFEDLPEINSPRWLSLEDFEGEEWIDVVGYEERLQISNYGRLKRKRCLSYNKHNNSYCTYKEKIIKTFRARRNHQHVCICIGDNKKINLSIHRLVMEAFSENVDNLPMVNHKDENPLNNCLYNLEWCTAKYNSNYGTATKRIRQVRIDKGYTKEVVLYTYDGEIIKEYETAKDAALDYNISGELVILCCENKVMSANGLHFRYKGEVYKKREITGIKNHYTVYKDGALILETKQTKEVCRSLCVNYSVFRKFIKYGGNKCKGLEPYVINIITQKGDELKITNGMKNFDRCV